MKSVDVREDSWHYWLATCFDRRIGYGQDNICAYTRKMAIGLFLLSFLVALCTALICCFGDALMWAVVCFVNKVLFEPKPVAMIFLMLLAVAVVTVAVAYVVNLKETGKIPPIPDPLAAALESFHNKVCFRIEVKTSTDTNSQPNSQDK